MLYVREAGARLGHGPKLDHDAGVGRAAEHRRSIDVEEGLGLGALNENPISRILRSGPLCRPTSDRFRRLTTVLRIVAGVQL